MAVSLNPTTPEANLLSFGAVVFDRINGIPSSINIGSLEQNNVVTDIPGGGRVVQFMGVRPMDVEWSGIILGPTAFTTLRTMQGYVTDGKERQLNWWVHSYYGLCKDFVATGRSANRLDYKCTITITRSADGSLPSPGSPTLAQIPAATFAFQANAAGIKIQAVDSSAAASGLGASLTSLYSKVAPTLADIAPVLEQAQAYGAVLAQLSPAFVPAQQVIANLTQMSSNLSATQVGRTVSVSGPASIYDIAAQNFGGDPTQAFAIMQLNNIYSPRIPAGVQAVLKLPLSAS